MMGEAPTARHDIPLSDFPFTIKAFNTRTGELVWTRFIEGPGPLYVPALAKQIGAPVEIVVEWPDGRTSNGGP